MRQVVGIADVKVVSSPEDELITHALGSCLGITIYDPVACVGGMLHVMLPDSRIDTAKAEANPSMFVDTGVPKLFRDSYSHGAKKERIVVHVAGGATLHTTEKDDMFQIGSRNFTMLRRILWKNGVLLDTYDVGGTVPRTLTLNMQNGDVVVSIHGIKTKL